MILPLQTCIQGYTLLEKIGRGTPYRETYLAINGEGKKVQFVIYDKQAMPVCYQQEGIREFELYPSLRGQHHLPYIAQGEWTEGEQTLAWLVREHAEGYTLAQCLKEGKIFPERQTLEQFYQLLVGLKELSWRLKGGVHNNISAENLWIGTTADGAEHWWWSDLSGVAQPSQGRPSFDTQILPVPFRAPETAVGRYNIKTDIFALGILLACLLQGQHPWEESLTAEVMAEPLRFTRIVRRQPPVLRLSDDLTALCAKALRAKPSERYRDLEDFGRAIAAYLGEDSLNDFSCFSNEEATAGGKVREQERGEGVTEVKEHQAEEVLPQPKSQVRFERKKGMGFKAVAGMGELKHKLTRNFVDILNNRELAQQFQITPPNGILLWGPPGTGKTFISMRLAEETDMLYCLVQPSDLGNVYLHGSQNMIADLFNRSEALAKKHHCGVLLVFDEFDSLVPRRGTQDNNHQANEVAEFLTRLNNCAEKNIFVVATTNRIEAIDPAITRKGRMDEMIYVGLPDEAARKELLELELQQRPHEDINMPHLAQLTQGYTSGDISFVVKECARHSFAESLKHHELVKISEEMLERTIAATRSSVSAEEMQQYERTRKQYAQVKPAERRHIGF